LPIHWINRKIASILRLHKVSKSPGHLLRGQQAAQEAGNLVTAEEFLPNCRAHSKPNLSPLGPETLGRPHEQQTPYPA